MKDEKTNVTQTTENENEKKRNKIIALIAALLMAGVITFATAKAMANSHGISMDEIEKNTTTSQAVTTTAPTTTTAPSTYGEYNIDWTVTTTEGQTFAVTNKETVIYTESNTESEQVATLPEGTQLIVDAESEENGFTQVTTTTGETGYVSSSSVLDVNAQTTTPVVTTVPTNTSAPATTTVVATTTPKTTTTVTSKKPTTTTTTTSKKNTTTTKKKTTTTTTTKKKDNSSSNSSVKGVTKWIGWETHGFTVGKNLDWWDNEYDVVLKEGDQITAYETVTVNTKNGGDRTLTKVKMSNGKYTYVLASEIVDEKPYIVEITESDVKKLCAELQEYSNSIFTKQNDYSPKDTEWMVEKENGDGYRWGTYAEYISKKTPSNSSWHIVSNWYAKQRSQNGITTYEKKLKALKDSIAYEYTYLPNSHQVIYYEKNTDPYSGEERFQIYFLY